MELTRRRVMSSILISSILFTLLITFSEKTIQLVYDVKSLLQNFEKDIDNSMGNEERELDELKSQLDVLNETFLVKQIDDFLQELSHIREVLVNYQQRAAIKTDFDEPMALHVFTYMAGVEFIYKEYMKYLRKEVNNHTLCDFAQSVTSNNGDELGNLLRRIEKYVMSEGKSLEYWSFFGIIKDYFMKLGGLHCGQASIQQKVYEFCELLIHNEKIAYLVNKRLYRQLAECFQGNYTDEMESALKGIVRRIRNFKISILTVIADLPREVRRCEPGVNIQNENFFELERVVRLMPIDERELNPHHECMNTCSNVSSDSISGMTLNSSYTINMKYCEDCESAKFIQICRAPLDSTRYFDKATPPPLKVLQSPLFIRRSLSCEGASYSRNQHSHHSPSHCETCVCKCTNPDLDTKWRYAISLRPQESNISENMIVTGIRFNKTNNPTGVKVIYPQIKVAKLLPGGLSEGFWKDVGNFDDGLWPSGKPGVDYAIIGKDENQSMIFNLNENRAKPGYIVTGVKFQLRHDHYHATKFRGDKDKILELVVRMTPYDFVTAKLSISRSWYTCPDAEVVSTFDEGVELKSFSRMCWGRTNKDVLANRKDEHMQFKPRQYIEISHSSEMMNFGQTTLPLFDLQSVDPEPALPLSGINLFYNSPYYDNEILGFEVTTMNIADLTKFARYKNL